MNKIPVLVGLDYHQDPVQVVVMNETHMGYPGPGDARIEEWDRRRDR